MSLGLDRLDFEKKARETVAEFWNIPRKEKLGIRVPLVILIEACAAAIAEQALAGESIEILSDRLSPALLRGLKVGFDVANAKRGHDVSLLFPL
jgi:tRNA A-37 threonylcarbamoyl transferase component Bud32